MKAVLDLVAACLPATGLLAAGALIVAGAFVGVALAIPRLATLSARGGSRK